MVVQQLPEEKTARSDDSSQQFSQKAEVDVGGRRSGGE
jgi:hypothetical protein